MINAMEGNLLLSQKIIKEKQMCLNFYSDISFTSSEISSHARFKLLTAYLREESDLCFFSIAYQQALRLLFCLGAFLVNPFSS